AVQSGTQDSRDRFLFNAGRGDDVPTIVFTNRRDATQAMFSFMNPPTVVTLAAGLLLAWAPASGVKQKPVAAVLCPTLHREKTGPPVADRSHYVAPLNPKNQHVTTPCYVI
ncbi:MAG: hypothetical protein AAFU65_06425, partial [Pseudomonadota bacterium]